MARLETTFALKGSVLKNGKKNETGLCWNYLLERLVGGGISSYLDHGLCLARFHGGFFLAFPKYLFLCDFLKTSHFTQSCIISIEEDFFLSIWLHINGT